MNAIAKSPFAWLLKREYWESRKGFFWAQVWTAVVLLAITVISIITLEVFRSRLGMSINVGANGTDMNALLNNALSHNMSLVVRGLDASMLSFATIGGIVMTFVVFFYFLGALYDDRRDRSILFWKSLPVSDAATVLSKVIAATVVAPFIAVVVGTVTGILMLMMFALTLSLHGVGVWHLLTLSHPLQVMLNLVGSIPLYLLWALPTVGWLMLCSAWARSKPFLWAVVLPVAIGVAIGWFNLLGTLNVSNSWYWREVLGRVLLSVFPGGWLTQVSHIGGDGPAELLSSLGVMHTYAAIGSLNLWIGVAAAVAMLAGAIWFRRWRDDS